MRLPIRPRYVLVPLLIAALPAAAQPVITWQLASADAWPPRRGPTLQMLAGHLEMLGGENDGTFVAYNDAWSSLDGTAWSEQTTAAPWQARAFHASAVFAGRIWIMGGGINRDQFVNFSDVWSSADGLNWTMNTGAAPWGPRRGLTAVAFADQLWVLGGEDDGTFIAHNDVWSSSDGVAWTEVTASAPWPARAFHASAVFAGRIWVLGGGLDSDQFANFNDVWSSEDGANWREETSTPGWDARRGASLVAAGGRLWLMGGQSDATFVAYHDVWSSADGATWTNHGDAPWSARTTAAAAAIDDRICIGGGGLDNDQFENFADVWCGIVGGNAAAVSAPTLSFFMAVFYGLLLTASAYQRFTRKRTVVPSAP